MQAAQAARGAAVTAAQILATEMALLELQTLVAVAAQAGL
jgi:hypothetical protein